MMIIILDVRVFCDILNNTTFNDCDLKKKVLTDYDC